MKKSELKQIIKPIVEECVKDAILTSGLLSTVISEVVAGLQKPLIKEHKEVKYENADTIHEEEKKRILENKKKLLDAIGSSSYNGVDVFEGTAPMKSGGQSKQTGYSPFEGVSPEDPGVNIDKLTSNLGNVWKKLAEGNKK